MQLSTLRSFALPAALAAALSGCAAGAPSSSLPYMSSTTSLARLDATGASKIKHIVYIVQENRSFDNMFYGYPGADTRTYGYTSDNTKVMLKPVSLAAYYVIDHSADAMFAACNAPAGDLPGTHCRMNGFNHEENENGPPNVKYPEYVYVPHKESQPYFDMAHQGVLADRMFQSQLDESFTAHQYVIAAQAAWSVNLPYGLWGCEQKGVTIATITKMRTYGPPESACFDYQTLGDELDNAHLSWKFYASQYGSASSGDGGTWSSYQAVSHIYHGPDWKKDVISPNWKFITDVRAGKLANFTWITPVCNDSDHVNCPDGYGPSWVSALVNTVGESPFWNSTAIFIQWDDWGGLYDHVAPAYLDRDSLGFRVPLVIMSPYAIAGTVSHTHYETASVLRFAENLWGLGQLAPADRRANSPADAFNFSQTPRKFIKIAAPLPPKFFMHQFPSDYFAPDYE
ncbi:MAG TPA: alkaline phosphatase family protein [Candidatus Cybelea sp.]|jgi:phospholipase C|nr:alkaline phosphatase family protein [Candidatus Cybelea sp.]